MKAQFVRVLTKAVVIGLSSLCTEAATTRQPTAPPTEQQERQARVPDPNQVNFTFRLAGYGHLNSTQATAEFEVLEGVPAYSAVLVNSTDWSQAVWKAYDGTAAFALGPTDGVYQVMFGLKGMGSDSRATWRGTSVVLDRQPPTVVITSPTLATVTKPYVQVQGYATKRLLAISGSLSNALGVQTNLLCLLTGPDNPPRSNFKVFDVPLTNGANVITVTVRDLAGNVTTTNVTCTLDYSGQTTGPAIEISWPQDRAMLAAGSFTLRGWVDDETASVAAQTVSQDGNANQAEGIVERNGRLWIEDLPLGAGTNHLTITAINAAGHSSVTNLTLVRSGVSVTIDEVPQSQLNQPTATVSGTISDNSYKVWVNGIGVLPVNGVWMAKNVPVPQGGTAVFAVTLIPLSDNGGDGSPPAGRGQGDPSGLNPTNRSAVESGLAPEK